MTTTAATTSTTNTSTAVVEMTSLITQAVRDFRDPMNGVSELNRERARQQAVDLRSLRADTEARLETARVRHSELTRFTGQRKSNSLPQNLDASKGFKLGLQVALRA